MLGYCLTDELSGEQVSKSNKVEVAREGEMERKGLKNQVLCCTVLLFRLYLKGKHQLV